MENFIVIYAADLECTGLLEDMKLQAEPLLHNFCVKNMATGQVLLFSNRYEELVFKKDYIKPISELHSFLSDKPTLVMHNGIGFDIEALVYLGYPQARECKVIDTLGISWYLEPTRIKHGLATYGEDFGVLKPEVEEWENQPQEVYNHRVLEDTKIQYLLWKQQELALRKIYDKESYWPLIEYLNMKMKHLSIQQQNKWEINVEATHKLAIELEDKLLSQKAELEKAMPKVPVLQLKTPPAKGFKANGALSSHGKKWYSLLLREHMPIDTKELVVTTGYKEPNAGSPAQIKDWLNSYGWKCETFKYEKDENYKERKIPQVNIANSGGLVDPGVIKLHEKFPEVGFIHIQGLGILKHRLGICKSFLELSRDGYMSAGASGFTNTLRLKHRNLVNIPSVRVPYGKEIRSLLIAGEGKVLLGSDLSSLEDKCKHHYQWKFDPEYVKMQQTEGFDPHLLMCEQAELLTPQQIQDHKDKKADYSTIRHAGKSCNYASQYGAGPPTIARAAGVSLEIAEKLHKAYHDLNWSIHAIAESTQVKKAAGMQWQKNPVNNLWYWLKTEKDRFSTLCQGTGSYICDMWIEEMHKICQEKWSINAPVIGEFHDETVLRLKDSVIAQAHMHDVVSKAMDRVNDLVKMNVTLACDIKFGHNYAEVH